MRRWQAVAWGMASVLAISGCGGGDPAGSTPGGQPAAGEPAAGQAAWVAHADREAVTRLDEPRRAVFEFLEAIRTGDDEKATTMLTTPAREQWGALGRSLNPPASDTARFQLGNVEHLGDDGARVVCRWTDLDEDGQPQTDEALWMVRREAVGWRVAGCAAFVFEGEPPLLLDYEKPEQVLRSLEWVREEIARREQQGADARQAEGPGGEIRR
jgi:hypothetical protein